MCILLVPSVIRQSTEASKKKKVHEAIKMWLYFLKGQSCHSYATLLQIFEQLLASDGAGTAERSYPASEVTGGRLRGATTRGVTRRPRSGAATTGVTPRPRSGVAAGRRYPTPPHPRPRVVAWRTNPTSEEPWLPGHRRA